MVVLDGTGGTNDAYVCEIPAGGKTKPQRHMYEEMVYVTKGYGATSVWQRDGKKKHTFEWGPGSMFAMPLNADYQHFNASGSEAARYFAVTNCCFMMNLFHNPDYIFNSDYAFSTASIRTPKATSAAQGRIDRAVFLDDELCVRHPYAQAHRLQRARQGQHEHEVQPGAKTPWARISPSSPWALTRKAISMAPARMSSFFPARVIRSSGRRVKRPQRVDWGPGSVVVPPDQWFHQHFNSGATPARYLALRWNNWRYKFMRSQDGEGGTFTSLKLGGGQIEFEDEDPQIHKDFEAAMKKVGAQLQHALSSRVHSSVT